MDRRSATEFSLGHNLASRDEVDTVMKRARDAGAVIVKAAGETFWGGYAGYFQDPNGQTSKLAAQSGLGMPITCD